MMRKKKNLVDLFRPPLFALSLSPPSYLPSPLAQPRQRPYRSRSIRSMRRVPGKKRAAAGRCRSRRSSESSHRGRRRSARRLPSSSSVSGKSPDAARTENVAARGSARTNSTPAAAAAGEEQEAREAARRSGESSSLARGRARRKGEMRVSGLTTGTSSALKDATRAPALAPHASPFPPRERARRRVGWPPATGSETEARRRRREAPSSSRRRAEEDGLFRCSTLVLQRATSARTRPRCRSSSRRGSPSAPPPPPPSTGFGSLVG